VAATWAVSHQLKRIQHPSLAVRKRLFTLKLEKAYRKTITFSKTGLQTENNFELINLLKENGYRDIRTIQNIPGNRAEVCFESEDTKQKILDNGLNYRVRHRRVHDSQVDLLSVMVCGVPQKLTTRKLRKIWLNLAIYKITTRDLILKIKQSEQE